MSEFLFRGMPALNMINENPFFNTECFYKTFVEETESGAFIKGCMAVKVDPDIVKKQADLIIKLQRALDCKLNDSFNLCAPSFKSYAELEKENEELKAKLKAIAGCIEENT